MVNRALILCEGGNDIGFLKKFCQYNNFDELRELLLWVYKV